jgi:hypothetical protein
VLEYQILTDAALLKRQKLEIEELRQKLQVRPVCFMLHM